MMLVLLLGSVLLCTTINHQCASEAIT